MLKKTDKPYPLPKYYQISESIKEKIAGGEFVPGGKIPTYQILTKYFNTTMSTICNAIQQLENDGYIHTVRGKGMFVTVPATVTDDADAAAASWKVGLAMHTRGDLIQNLVEVLVHDLEKHDIDAFPLSTVLPNTNYYLKEKCLEKCIAKGIDTLVMDGSRDMPYKLLLKRRADFKQLNFLMHYNSAIDFPDANIIVFDYAGAGRLAAEHLIKAGREKFAFVTFKVASEAERRRYGCRGADECHDMAMVSGMKSVLQEAGFPESCLTVIRENAPFTEKNITYFTELLKEGPWGIFAVGDFRTVEIYKAAARIGLDFKQNLSIVGLYNTSWTEVLHPTLTSISINETEIAHLAADCIINRKTGQRIVVEPKLIVRET